MASWARYLCLFLTLWMAGSRRPAITRVVDDDPWWGTKDAVEAKHQADEFRIAGDYAALEGLERRNYARAREQGDEGAALRYLIGAGASQLLESHFRSAIQTFLKARELAARLRATAETAAIAVNLSSAYLQVWDVEAALKAAEEGVAVSRAPRA